MIELKITGTNYKEIKQQVFQLANDISTDTDDDIQIQPASIRNDVGHTGVGITAPMAMAQGPGVAGPVQPEAPAKRTRRSKAEIEAEKAAKLAAAQAEVQQAQASHAPAITIPQVPTTQHVVNIPTEAPQQQVAPAVVQPIAPPPVQVAPPGAYTLETFKQNLVMILNGLLNTGKLNSAWIADTSTQVFNGADIWLWSQNETKIAELFNMFIQWGFIQEFKG